MQLFFLIVMEFFNFLDVDSICNEKVKVVQVICLVNLECLEYLVICGQYIQGWMKGKSVLVYWEEGGVNFNFIIFMYVVLKFNIDNWCWKGVLFYLWIGK